MTGVMNLYPDIHGLVGALFAKTTTETVKSSDKIKLPLPTLKSLRFNGKEPLNKRPDACCSTVKVKEIVLETPFMVSIPVSCNEWVLGLMVTFLDTKDSVGNLLELK